MGYWRGAIGDYLSRDQVTGEYQIPPMAEPFA